MKGRRRDLRSATSGDKICNDEICDVCDRRRGGDEICDRPRATRSAIGHERRYDLRSARRSGVNAPKSKNGNGRTESLRDAITIRETRTGEPRASAVIVGEAANFAAYAFAPAILVTPLGALSIIVSAVLAHFMLNEKLHMFGVLGCNLCVVGSTTIVLHAPKEKNIESVKEVWYLATELGFIVYTCLVVALVVFLIFRLVPRCGRTHLIVYVGICSLMGSLTVMNIKAISIALKLTIEGMNQFIYAQTWFFSAAVIVCILTQMNYLNKALDTFNTAVISPVYYVMFTSFTILASMIMFKDWDSQNASQIATELCGFVTILSGTFLLHKTKDMGSSINSTRDEANVPNALNKA